MNSTARDTTVDVLRGLAIFLMIQGNVAASLFHGTYPLWGKIYFSAGSFVPALFILLLGMVVVYTTQSKHYTLKHFLVRAVGLVFVAAIIIDFLIWGSVPIFGVDILYILAFLLPVAYLFQKLPGSFRWASTALVFLLTPLLQHIFSYSYLGLAFLHGASEPFLSSAVWHRLFIDGWFPLFPWMGFAFLGVNVALLRGRVLQSFAKPRIVFTGALILLAGLALWVFYHGPLYFTGGFNEIIYPPTLAYILTAIGEITLLFALVDWRPNVPAYKPLVVFGQSALFLYWFHYLLIRVFPSTTSVGFIVGEIALIVGVCGVTAYLLQVFRRATPAPGIVRYLLGV